MPKNKVKTQPINVEVFRYVLRKKGSSIRKLDAEQSIECSDKTIRRALKNGQMRQKYIDQIAQFLDVDSRLLTGEMVKGAFETENEDLKKLFFSCLDHIDRFPYFHEEQEKIYVEGIEETLRRLLSLFEISYIQFERKSFIEQYRFQYELFYSIIPIILKHFDCDGYGNAEMPNCERILFELENMKDRQEEGIFAEEVLRGQFLASPPPGVSRDRIRRMTADELLALDYWAEEESNT